MWPTQLFSRDKNIWSHEALSSFQETILMNSVISTFSWNSGGEFKTWRSFAFIGFEEYYLKNSFSDFKTRLYVTEWTK